MYFLITKLLNTLSFMLSKIVSIIAFAFISETVLCQGNILFSDEDCKVSYSFERNLLFITVEDLKPKSTIKKNNVRKAGTGDYYSTSGHIQVEFDKNNSGIFDAGDWGMFTEYSTQTTISGYSLYNGWDGLYIHKLNKGFDVQTKTKVLATYGSRGGSDPLKCVLQFPLNEVMNATSKKINFQVSIYRQPDPDLLGYFIDLPKSKNQFSNTFEIRVAANGINAEIQNQKEQEKIRKVNYSKTKYVSKIEYDGIYIDMGNGKFAELTASTGENGVVASMYGTRPINYYKDVPYLKSLSTTVLITQCNRIIFKGSDFQGDFLKWLTIHEMENLAEQNLQKVTSMGTPVTIKTLAYAGKFGSSYSLKADQPEYLYTPAINKQTLQDWITVDYNTKTINANNLEVKIASSLIKGKIYCLWSGQSYFLFELQ